MQNADTEELLQRTAAGDTFARDQLLERYSPRLRRFVAIRMDRRLVARLDPSDVVQETLLSASQKLSEYLLGRPLPFYPWLLQIAIDRLRDSHRGHLIAHKRSVLREQDQRNALPDESAVELARHLIDSGTSPSGRVMRKELQQRVREALARLSDRDHEILILRYLEELSISETAVVLGVTEGAVKVATVRALKRCRAALGSEGDLL